jgi:hypothetical protein
LESGLVVSRYRGWLLKGIYYFGLWTKEHGNTSCQSLLALSNDKWEVEESIPYSVGYGEQVRALQVNWTQELHLVPEHRRVWLEACK